MQGVLSWAAAAAEMAHKKAEGQDGASGWDQCRSRRLGTGCAVWPHPAQPLPCLDFVVFQQPAAVSQRTAEQQMKR